MPGNVLALVEDAIVFFLANVFSFRRRTGAEGASAVAVWSRTAK